MTTNQEKKEFPFDPSSAVSAADSFKSLADALFISLDKKPHVGNLIVAATNLSFALEITAVPLS